MEAHEVSPERAMAYALMQGASWQPERIRVPAHALKSVGRLTGVTMPGGPPSSHFENEWKGMTVFGTPSESELRVIGAAWDIFAKQLPEHLKRLYEVQEDLHFETGRLEERVSQLHQVASKAARHQFAMQALMQRLREAGTDKVHTASDVPDGMAFGFEFPTPDAGIEDPIAFDFIPVANECRVVQADTETHFVDQSTGHVEVRLIGRHSLASLQSSVVTTRMKREREWEQLNRTLASIQFRQGVLSNVLKVHLYFGAVPYWSELGEQQQGAFVEADPESDEGRTLRIAEVLLRTYPKRVQAPTSASLRDFYLTSAHRGSDACTPTN